MGFGARRFAVLLVGTMMVIQIGTALQKIRENTFANDYMPTVEYLRKHAGNGTSITATAAIGFDFSYENFIDDGRLGFHTGRQAELVVMDRFYEMWREYQFKNEEPAVYDYVMELLANKYHMVLDSGSFKIMRRNHEQALTTKETTLLHR